MRDERPAWAGPIEAVLAAQGRRKEWLAGVLQMDIFAFSRMLNGSRPHFMTESRRRAIALALGVPYDYLFGATEEAEAKGST